MKNYLVDLEPPLFALVSCIGAIAEEKGMKAYLVGGPVRDLVLKSSNIDLDITVEGQAIRLADAFAAEFNGKVTHYPAFKTATVKTRQYAVDFATCRKETYARGGAFPAVKPSGIADDLFRRDFTINAMAVSINPGTWGRLIDPFGGMKDLKAGKIRILHEASFADDPTRILRAARFAARLGFKIEAKTLQCLQEAVARKVLDSIKPQRYRKDFNKILKEETSPEAVRLLKEWNAYQ